MRLLFVLMITAGLVPMSAVSAQEKPKLPILPVRGAARLEEQTVKDLITLWRSETNETVRKKAAETLQQMAAELLPVFAAALSRETKLALAGGSNAQQHFESVQLLAVILGRLGNAASRDTDVARELLLIAAMKDRMPAPPRQAAVEALGKIYANRSIFLILDRQAFWERERLKQPTPREMTEELKNEAATLKERIGLKKNLSVEEAQRLIVEIRLARKRIARFHRVINLLNELEPPQEDNLGTRIFANLSGIESNLQSIIVAEKDKAGTAVAIAKAESYAGALFDEMAKVSDNVWYWQDLNQSTTDVIAGLAGLLNDANPHIRYAASEALGHIYGKSH